MKSEERHELKENALADWIYHVPALLNKYGTHLLFGLVLILLAWNGYRWYSNYQRDQLQHAWSELAAAASSTNPPGKFADVAASYNIKPVQAQAYAGIGDFYSGILTLGTTPSQYSALKNVTPEYAQSEAEKAYSKILADYADQPMAVRRAYMGLARLYQDQGEFTKAREQYQKLTATDTPYYDAAFAAIAQYNLEHLDQWKKPVTFGPPTTQPASAAGLGHDGLTDLSTLLGGAVPTGEAQAPASGPAATQR